jgi:hypothetical protein
MLGRRPASVLSSCALALLGLVSCAEEPAIKTPAVAGVSADAIRTRTDEALGNRLQVRVTNTGTSALRITSVALAGPLFGATPATPRDTALTPGRVVDLPVTHGPANCAADPATTVAVLTVALATGPTQVRLPLADSAEELSRIAQDACTAQRIASVVEVSLVPGARRSEDDRVVLDAVIRLHRAGSDRPAIEATHVGGSVLFDVTPASPGSLPAVLPPAEELGEIPVTVRSTRCTGHEIGEAKKPFDVGVWLRVDGAEDTWTAAATSPGAQDRLRAFLSAACRPR